ncbi:MAG TPA: ATP-binding protein [Polyangia bacterium]|nr:ATP-binding protein [Polyangia bacterium]
MESPLGPNDIPGLAEGRLAALIESEQRLRRLADVLPGLVSYVDRNRRYLFVNQLYEAWFGLARQDVVGRTTDEVLGPELMAQAGPNIERALRGEEVRFEHEGPYPGGPRYVQGAYIPDVDERGEVLGFAVFVVDNTKRKLAEEALRESEARHREANLALKAADRRKDEFLATISHELRNPLAAIRNAVSVLLQTASPDPSTRWVSEMVGRQLQHVSRLLEDLLDVSRIAHDKLVLREERTLLEDVIRAAVDTCRPSLDAANHQITITLPPRISLEVDAIRLAQVFSNLIGNAAKYTARGGHIEVTAESRANEVVVSVKDDGIGISAELLPRVFEIFSQGERALDGAEDGLGLGLSLVKGLVELHGGHVEAHSEGVGKGSTFVVHLPAGAEDTLAAAPPAPSAAPRLGARSRVLIADDLRDITDSLAIVMRRVGFEVHTAYDGEQAVARFEEVKPHVVILDLGMPKLDGYEACRRIRARPGGQALTLIALTGWGGKVVHQRTGAAGFDHHLVKPVDPAALLELLASLD